MMTGKECFLATTRGELEAPYPFMPITMMFAADLIGVPYKQYATDSKSLAAGQRAVAERFSTSHVSAISDPAVEAADLGASVMMEDDAPPALREDEALLLKKERLSSLKPVAPEDGRRMSNRLDAVRLLQEQCGESLVVEGWVEGPCAEAADLRGINHIMVDFFDDPPFIEDLLDLVTEQEIRFALAQIAAGADLIGIGDAASSLIGPAFYEEFILPRTRRYVEAVHQAGAKVRLHICGNINAILPHIAALEVDMIDLDSMTSISDARKWLGPGVALAGNLDPVAVVKESSPGMIFRQLGECRDQAQGPFIVAAGCEIPRGTPGRNLDAMSGFARDPLHPGF